MKYSSTGVLLSLSKNYEALFQTDMAVKIFVKSWKLFRTVEHCVPVFRKVCLKCDVMQCS